MSESMHDVYIVEALRTPFGSFGGNLSEISAPLLASQVISELIKRTQVPAAEIEEIIIGQVLQGGCGQAPARQAMLLAGLPAHIPAMTINKVCSSGLKAMMLAADAIKAGEKQMIIAGGMESMSLAPYILPQARTGYRLGHGKIIDLMMHDGLEDSYSQKSMGEITEDWLDNHKHLPTRRQQDDYTARSYRLAQAALQNGVFDEEIITVTKKSRKGDLLVTDDEEPNRVDLNKLHTLRPVFKKDGTITAGNSSTISDGAALALIAGAGAVAKNNLKPIAKLIASATSSKAPELFPEADVGAIRKVVEKAGLQLDDIGLFEINEAFAAVAIITSTQLGLDVDKVNVNGGAVAIGHPIGASGGRLVTTLIKEMKRRNERYGVVALCNGGGEAVASVFELV